MTKRIYTKKDGKRKAEVFSNAIVGIDIDYETVGESGSMLMAATSGTAVVI